jgi:RNA polymerase sigma-70 factor (ECF subfamily)
MIEDKLLIWKFKNGSREALQRIYEKYVGLLLTLATALLNDMHAAEDVVHEVFLLFAESAERIKLEGSLKSYLATCVANRARDRIRARQRQPATLDNADDTSSRVQGPDLAAVCSEELQRLSSAMAQLPYEQREVIVMHLQAGMMFKHIAKSQNVSLNTIQSRYRYGLNKLRSLLDSEVTK